MKKSTIILLILSALAIVIAGCAEKEKKIETYQTPQPTEKVVEKKITSVEINVSDVEKALEEIKNLEKELAVLENITFEDI